MDDAHVTFKMPEYVVLPSSKEEIASLVKLLTKSGVPYVVRGNGASTHGLAFGEGAVRARHCGSRGRVHVDVPRPDDEARRRGQGRVHPEAAGPQKSNRSRGCRLRSPIDNLLGKN